MLTHSEIVKAFRIQEHFYKSWTLFKFVNIFLIRECFLNYESFPNSWTILQVMTIFEFWNCESFSNSTTYFQVRNIFWIADFPRIRKHVLQFRKKFKTWNIILKSRTILKSRIFFKRIKILKIKTKNKKWKEKHSVGGGTKGTWLLTIANKPADRSTATSRFILFFKT